MEVGVPGRCGNPPVHIISHFNLITFYMIGGVTRHMLPYLSGVLHLHINRPYVEDDYENKIFSILNSGHA